MPSCSTCGDEVGTGARAEIRVEPKGPLAAELEPYTSYLCPSCVFQHQQVADVDDPLTNEQVERVETAAGTEPAIGD